MEYALSPKASISLQTMSRPHERLRRVPAAALSAGLSPRVVGQAVDLAAARARVLVETANVKDTESALSNIEASRINYIADGFISAEIPVQSAEKIYNRNEVKKLQSLKTKSLRLDRAIENGAVVKGTARLVEQTGRGVLVAVIDSGFDLNHPMFRDSSGNLRVEALFDQSKNDMELTGQQLATAWANGQRPGGDDNGHGTHVATIAAGSPFQGLAGVAPDARFLLIKTDYLDLAAGASWAFRKAGDKPCVVNIRLGHHFGAHDGTDQEERAFERLINTAGDGNPARIIVVAAGNERTDKIHIGLRFSPGQSEEAVFDIEQSRDPTQPPHVTLTLWYSKADEFDFVLVTPSGQRLPVPAPDRSDSQLDSGAQIELSRLQYPFNDLIQVQVSISFTSPMVPSRLLRGWKVGVICRAANNGRIDGWFHNSGFAEFRDGTILETARTIGMPATSRAALAVASHVSKNEWASDLGTQRDQSAVVGRSSSFSSRGPTRDGAKKPEISAPGQYITAALADQSEMAGSPARAASARHLLTIEGTSMATPFMTGVIALMLEQNPRLDIKKVRDALSGTAVKDQHTSQLDWTPEYGYGKVSAAALLRQLIA
jgi:subtilisin family serine protease